MIKIINDDDNDVNDDDDDNDDDQENKAVGNFFYSDYHLFLHTIFSYFIDQHMNKKVSIFCL